MEPTSIIDIEPWQPPGARVYYLHSNPVEAARAVPDAHVDRAIVAAAVLLANAQRLARLQPAEGAALEEGFYPAGRHRYTPTGDHNCHVLLLHGLRIPTRRLLAADPTLLWAAQRAANYRWVWAQALVLLGLWTAAHGCTHRMAPALWALEFCPPTLPDGPHTEPPAQVAPEYLCYVAEGGQSYVDAVASYRAWVQAIGGRCTWQGSAAVPWLAV